MCAAELGGFVTSELSRQLNIFFTAVSASDNENHAGPLLSFGPELIRAKARYAATLSALPDGIDGTRSKGSLTLTIVPVPSDRDGTIAPPSWRTKIAT